MRADITLSTDVVKTGRLLQMAGMMDVPVEEKAKQTWHHQLPIEERDWQVGLVVGPSGAGKSVLANKLWPGELVTEFDWPADGSILDAFPEDMGIRDITGLLTSVGLASVPAWMRPYRTLSNGEAFRATAARALAESKGLVVLDEFTSVVDRQVAKVASHTIQKTVRRQGRKLVAVTCHYDVLDWLQPDWVYDLAGGKFTWRSVQPHPRLQLAIHQVDRSVWPVFARHHYLSSEISKSAHCFGAFLGDECVAFTSYIHFPHAHTKNIKMAHRTVVLPDYQGLGISGRMAEWVGQMLWDQGYRYRRNIAHPAVIAYCERSPRWRDTSARSKKLTTTSRNAALRSRSLNPRLLTMRSFEYTPPKKEAP
jgi:ABC-type lipoprotein export system ATPase subunit/GNAT superfamily N-acetyltransferase